MARPLDFIYRHQSLLYKIFLYLIAVILVVWMFPGGGKFKYDFSKGRPWQYENLYAPFDFSLKKSQAEIDKELAEIDSSRVYYYRYSDAIYEEVVSNYSIQFEGQFQFEDLNNRTRKRLFEVGKDAVHRLYTNGIFPDRARGRNINLMRANTSRPLDPESLITEEDLPIALDRYLAELPTNQVKQKLSQFILGLLQPNASLDEELTENSYKEVMDQFSFTRGTIYDGEFIIAKGTVVEDKEFRILQSLKDEYESELFKGDNSYLILLGYSILVALALLMLFLFLQKYRPEVFADNNKISFILFNILLMVFITTMVVKNFTSNEAWVYAVPLCILPLILKNFFDARLGLFTHVITLLILGFVVPNSFEYIFLQITAGIVTILGVSQLYKRTNLFIAVGQITLIYFIGYLAFHSIHEASLAGLKWQVFAIFLLNGMITLFAQPLIYLYEKIFGLVSDISLLELSDTNSTLLKQLSDQAPGTFHHSLQVANLAEAAANEIGANSLLVRVGALYHDIGKMTRPTFYTENQVTNVNPHDDLPPKESAKIILDHVLNGIEIARKNKLPDRVIDFIRTHHGTSLVYYFYKKQKDLDPETDEADFRYPGPIPFSKETAILMMSDAVEAASKSLKSPTFSIIDDFVDKIVKGQMEADQFLNANITFKEIEAVKKVLKQKLINIYHLRVEYPE